MVSKKEFVALSEFRFQLARFQRFSVSASRRGDLTQTQYLMLLHIAGRPDREWSTVGELARRLCASPHGTAALVNRCVALKLVSKQRSTEDARRVEVQLTERGRRAVDRVAALHREELQSLGTVFRVSDVNVPAGR
ncbi:MAG TPA: MarR family winged helix-turn-helix transcriptional regulator [Steroidobacteraceae bacterium]|nr:MarR family winged helix-turn-helix transcriptional regulator [Steroidobacteraceae bacterium]